MITRLTIIAAILGAFILGADIDAALSQPIKPPAHTIKRVPVYIAPKPGKHFNEQLDKIAAVIPASALQPWRKK